MKYPSSNRGPLDTSQLKCQHVEQNAVLTAIVIFVVSILQPFIAAIIVEFSLIIQDIGFHLLCGLFPNEKR